MTKSNINFIKTKSYRRLLELSYKCNESNDVDVKEALIEKMTRFVEEHKSSPEFIFLCNLLGNIKFHFEEFKKLQKPELIEELFEKRQLENLIKITNNPELAELIIERFQEEAELEDEDFYGYIYDRYYVGKFKNLKTFFEEKVEHFFSGIQLPHSYYAPLNCIDYNALEKDVLGSTDYMIGAAIKDSKGYYHLFIEDELE